MELSKRLEACLNHTVGFLHLADIGTDHALLPIEAVLRGHVMDAIAIDNKFGPYLQARNNIKRFQMTDRVKVRLGDGLEPISDETDVVVISGMGGELMARILEEGNRRNVKRFVLQPNRNVEILRRGLMNLGYSIIDELVLEDHGKLYDVIIAESGKTTYTEAELIYGPINLRQRPHFFLKRLERDIKTKRSILLNVDNQKRRQELLDTIATMEAILHDGT